jgi:glycine/D-amino acid oxidase-like deaminating enzyme
MNATADAVVLGAGIVGAACADALSSEGMRVVVVEPGPVGGGATAAGMGHIVVMDDSEAQFALTRYSAQLWEDLAPSLPPEVEWDACGTLWVAADADQMEEVRRKEAFYSARRVAVSVLDQQAAAEAEPNLRAGIAGALLVPGDRVIYAPCAADWLVRRAVGRRASLRLGVAAVQVNGDGVRLTDGSSISAGVVVCATGTWAVELFPGLAVRARKGHLAITARYPGFVRHQVVELGYLKSAHGHSNESVAFNVQPRRTGQVLIGSSRQYGATESRVEHAILARMLRRAAEYIPAIARLTVVRCWTGFRAATEDKLPVVGECPGRKGVYLATGHEGLGITTSLGTARLLADMVMGRTPAIEAAPFLPSRMVSHV